MPLPLINEQNFEREILDSDVPVLVEFGAEWCGPCKTVLPELEALSRELSGKAKVVQIDIDKAPLLAQQMGVQSVPTFVVFHQGRPVDGRQGALRKAQLQQLLEPFLPRAAGALKPEEVMKLLTQRRIALVDTRAAEVFGRAHIQGAVSLPADVLESRLAELGKLQAIPVLYCRDGKQSQELSGKLAKQGLPVSFLEGGVLAWESAGGRLARPD
jgi:thioredoxin 1/putative thioredoxin